MTALIVARRALTGRGDVGTRVCSCKHELSMSPVRESSCACVLDVQSKLELGEIALQLAGHTPRLAQDMSRMTLKARSCESVQ